MTHLYRTAAAAALLTLFSVPAIAQSKQCISQTEGRAVVAHLMPDLVTRAATHCAPVLGPDAFLPRNAVSLANRMTPLSERSRATAIRALERQSGETLPDNKFLLDLGRVALAEGIAREMDDRACTLADAMLEQLDPLPPENLSNVFALALEAGVNGDPDSAIQICPVP